MIIQQQWEKQMTIWANKLIKIDFCSIPCVPYKTKMRIEFYICLYFTVSTCTQSTLRSYAERFTFIWISDNQPHGYVFFFCKSPFHCPRGTSRQRHACFTFCHYFKNGVLFYLRCCKQLFQKFKSQDVYRLYAHQVLRLHHEHNLTMIEF